MKKTIAELMRQGMPLDEIHAMMEEAFNEAYKEREQEQKDMEIAAMRDRAARALVDYMNAVLGDILDEPIETEGAAELLDEAIEATRMKLDIMRAFGAEIKKMPAPMRAVHKDDDEALNDFLYDLGLIQPK
jgi:hypothetical protein